MSKLSWLWIALLCVCACEKEDVTPVAPDDLPSRVQEILPPAILDSMLKLGMPIYPGDDPPLVEGTYDVSRFVLKSSNHPGDFPGKLFKDYVVTFEEQNNERHEVKVTYTNGNESGKDVGSLISGTGCQFSVYIEFDSSRIGNATARVVHVLSGTMTDAGIQGFHYANFMVDDRSDPTGVFIENGQGRVILDQDGDSPRQGSDQPVWYDRLPDCPCELTDAIDGKVENCGRWQVCPEASQEFHYGATHEIRWIPDESRAPGQQCTYDADRRLITGGLAAGSPDKTSPRSCGEFTWSLKAVCDHYAQDVIPWGATNAKGELCLSTSTRPVTCEQYLRDWPANRGDGCQENVIAGIAHITRMVRTMHCDDVTTLLRSVASSEVLPQSTKDFIAGKDVSPPDDLRAELQAHLDAQICERINTEAVCRIIERAIRNL
ncbi:hypothetical protein LEM8419_02656 [Neolewinella maritima]|uniref:AMOP domain-containing protein n=1 Tax=Neolewinella maritima TaxID=1383882 RepID=A0ABN8FB33_9BACT|nr:hypothetical protein [Neolewinella maritima]CAH1001750.1 hypothetical protein LEM8419_02656 [Neolewinella maritima]